MLRSFARLAIIAAVLCGPLALHAQTFPSKTIRLVIPYAPGGVTDFVARELSQKLQDNVGQSVVVDNRPGGNFIIGAELVAKAAPDGYTLFLAPDSTFTLNPLQYSTLSYDLERDFEPICTVALQTLFLVASKNAPGATFTELMQFAKAHPGKVTFGTTGLINQMVGEQLKMRLGVDILHVPYKSSPQMLQSLLAGDLDFSITTFVPYATYVKDAKLRGLAVTGTAHEPIAAETPTLTELGYPDLTYRQWLAVFAPARTPRPIVDKLVLEIRKVLEDSALRRRFAQSGVEASPGSPEELRALIRHDLDKWTKVVKDSGIKLE